MNEYEIIRFEKIEDKYYRVSTIYKEISKEKYEKIVKGVRNES